MRSKEAFARGLVRPFLCLATMDPAVRLNCAALLGFSYITEEFFGDAHAEVGDPPDGLD